ncbi:hypothetical protein IJG71_01920 [Candidatus Saccharibacteria bacterium]|nr:hypothetical protein [Candidatus Saccharibacteria bacterium]
MSKKIIAGLGVVAGLAVALAPVATFATDVTIQTDELVVTIESACSFGHDFTDATDIAAPSHNDASGDAATWSVDTATLTMEPGTSEDTFGTTKLNVYCNDVHGYNIAMTSSTNFNLAGANSGTNIPAAASYSASVSGWTLTAAMTSTSGNDHTIKNSYTTAKAAAETDLAGSTTATKTDGDTIDITYGVGVANNQAADVYTGDITYTLAANPSA